MTEQFYKRHPEHFFRGKKATLTKAVWDSTGTPIFADREVVIVRKFKGLGILDPVTKVFVAQVPFGIVELVK